MCKWRIPKFCTQEWCFRACLSIMRRHKAQFRSVLEIAPESPYLCVTRSPTQLRSRVGARALYLSVNIALDLQATNTGIIELYLYLCAKYLSIAITSISKRSRAWMTGGSIISCTALWHLL